MPAGPGGREQAADRLHRQVGETGTPLYAFGISAGREEYEGGNMKCPICYDIKKHIISDPWYKCLYCKSTGKINLFKWIGYFIIFWYRRPKNKNKVIEISELGGTNEDRS